MNTCVGCKQPKTETGLMCPACQTRMRNRLAEIVEFYALAEHELVPGSGSGARGSERSLGVRLAALDFLAGHDVVAVLGSWERDWRETFDLTDAKAGRDVQATLVQIVGFLIAWLDRACADHPAIDDFDRELRECWETARNAARMSPARSIAITCVADVERGNEIKTCGCRIPVGADGITGRVTCKRCKTTWDVPHLLHVAISTPGAELWADPEAAAGYFRVDPSTLRKWARAGRIRREHGRYDLGSIHAAIVGASQTDGLAFA